MKTYGASILFAALVGTQVLAADAHAGHHASDSCNFAEGITKDNKNLAIAGQAFGSTDVELAAPHHTVFVPNNDAFTALLTSLNVTAQELLTDPKLKDKLYGILAYHVLAPKGHYVNATLVGNKTIPTQLATLGKDPAYTLIFAQPSNTVVSTFAASNESSPVQIQAAYSTAITLADPKRICDREVFVIDSVLLPGDVSATTVSNFVAASEPKANIAESPDSGDDSESGAAAEAAESPGSGGDSTSGASSASISCLAFVGSALLLLAVV